MKKILFILLILINNFIYSQNSHISDKVTIANIRTLINNNATTLAATIDATVVAGMQLLPANWTMNNFVHWTNNNFAELAHYFNTENIDSLTFGVTGLALQTIYNDNIDKLYADYTRYNAYNTDAKALFMEFDTIPDDANATLVSDFYTSISGIKDSIFYLVMPAINTTHNALIDWKSHNTDEVMGYVYHDRNKGFVQYSADGYIKSFYKPSDNIKLNYAGIGVYVLDDYNDGSPFSISTGSNILNITPGYPGELRGYLNSSNMSRIVTKVGYKGFGYIKRISATDTRGMWNGTFLTNSAKNSTGVPIGYSFYLRATADGVPNGSSFNRVAALTITGRISDADVTTLYNAFDTYMTGIGAKNSDQIYRTAMVDYKISVINKFPNRHIATQHESYKFGFASDTLFFSINNGITYPYKKKWIDDDLINMAWISDNGVIVFATSKNQMFYSANNLTSVDTMRFEGLTIHTPTNPTYPGQYFNPLNPPTRTTINGVEIMIFGNYANVTGGAAPISVYEWRSDNIDTLKVAYQFGQNLNRRDDGTTDGGTTGIILGNADNPLTIDHIHAINYQSSDISWWIQTGDEPAANIGLMKAIYDFDLDTFTVTLERNYNYKKRYRSCGIYFYGDSALLVSDVSFALDTAEAGIFKCAYGDLLDYTKHRKVYFNGTEIGTGLLGIMGDGDKVIVTTYLTNNTAVISNDFGEHWTNDVLMHWTGDLRFAQEPDDDGYFLLFKGQPWNTSNSFLLKIK